MNDGAVTVPVVVMVASDASLSPVIVFAWIFTSDTALSASFASVTA